MYTHTHMYIYIYITTSQGKDLLAFFELRANQETMQPPRSALVPLAQSSSNTHKAMHFPSVQDDKKQTIQGQNPDASAFQGLENLLVDPAPASTDTDDDFILRLVQRSERQMLAQTGQTQIPTRLCKGAEGDAPVHVCCDDAACSAAKFDWRPLLMQMRDWAPVCF